jgi:hypothetical protein
MATTQTPEDNTPEAQTDPVNQNGTVYVGVLVLVFILVVTLVFVPT